MKSKYLWLVFVFTLAVTVPLRLYQLFFLVDERGFYTDGGTIAWILMAVLLAASAILIFSASTSRRLPKRYVQQRDIPSGLINIGLGVVAVIYSIEDIIRIAAPGEGQQSMAGSLLYVAIILAFFGVGAGAVWIMNGISCLIRKNLIRLLPLAGILPPLWLAIKLFTQSVQFSGNNITLNSTEAMYETLTLIAITLFSFNHCKMIAGAQGKKCGKLVYAFGFPMILFAVNAALPSLVALTGDRVETGSFRLLFSIMLLLLCLTALVFLFMLPRGKNAFVEELITVEQEPEQAVEEEKKEKVKPEGSFLKRAVMAILRFFAKVNFKLSHLGKRRKVVPFETAQLDEKPTMRIDDSWRLDFYGITDDEDAPYQARVYDLSEEELSAIEEKRHEVREMVEEDRRREEEDELRIPLRKRTVRNYKKDEKEDKVPLRKKTVKHYNYTTDKYTRRYQKKGKRK